MPNLSVMRAGMPSARVGGSRRQGQRGNRHAQAQEQEEECFHGMAGGRLHGKQDLA